MDDLDLDLGGVRDRLAVRVSRYMFLFGALPLAIVWWQIDYWPLWHVVGLTAAWAVVGWLAFLPTPYRVRRGLLLAAMFVVSTQAAIAGGLLPGGIGAAAILCLLAAFLCGWRRAATITILAVATLLAIGALHATGVYRVAAKAFDVTRAGNWVRTGASLLWLAVIALPAMIGHLRTLAGTTLRSQELLDAAVLEEARRHASVEAQARADAERRRSQGLLALGRLGGGFAHECSNRLQAIRGELDLLSMQPSPARSTMVEQGIGDMSEAVDAATAVLRRLLALSGREIAAEAAPLDVGAFVRVTQRQLRMVERLSVETQVEECPHALGDAASLHGVLLNLALNARDAMPAGGVFRMRARAATESERSETGCAAAIDVTDSGPGMDAATMAHLFEPFFTTKGASGTGLGLAAAKRVLEAGGGRVHVSSLPGQGTTFTLLLAAAGETTPKPEERAAPQDVAPGACVLVVDDDDAVRRAWRIALSRRDFRVVEARSVDEALPLVKGTRVVLAWMDAVMPGRPTRDLIEELRREQPHAHLVVCSGHVEEELLRRDLHGGEIDFVAKPCSLSVLIDRARRAAEENAAPRA